MLLVPAGGGFSINPSIALEAENLASDKKGELTALREQWQFPADENAWWWD